MRNFEGVITTYTEPENYQNTCHCSVCTGKAYLKNPVNGVAELAVGIEQKSLEPNHLLRRERKEKWNRENTDSIKA